MPSHDEIRARLLAELATNTIWALRPEAIAIVYDIAAGQLSIAEARQQLALPDDEDDGDVDERGDGSVAVIPLQGLITPKGSWLDLLFGGGGGLQGFRAALRAAVNDPAIASIVLDVDSPGGYHTLVPETAADVLAARAVKPVTAIANAMAASAAYYIASQADELVVTPSGVVGSIGVYSTHEDHSRLAERIGIKVTLISAGPFKTERTSHAPLGDEARADMQAEVDTLYEEFVADIGRGRGTTIDDVRENFGQGRCMRATAALAAGVVDRVETFDDALERVLAGDVTPRAIAPAAAAPTARAGVARPRGGRAISAPPMRFAAFAGELQAAASVPAAAGAAGQGIAWVTGNAAVFGSRSSFGEVFVPGAFADSVTDTTNPLPMVDMHRQAIGSWSQRDEDIGRLQLAGAISDTQAGRDVRTLLRDGAMNGLSVGYWPHQTYLAGPGETVRYDTPYGAWSCTQERWTLYVRRADLVEASIVYVPADPEARVTNIGSMSAEQLGTALPGLRAGAPWEDVAYSMARLMGAPGAGLHGLAAEERHQLYRQLHARYGEHGQTAPLFSPAPDYRTTNFHAGEPALYQDRSLGKRCADVVAAIGGSTGRPLSDGTRTRAIAARDALQLLLVEQHEDTDDLAALAAQLGTALATLQS